MITEVAKMLICKMTIIIYNNYYWCLSLLRSGAAIIDVFSKPCRNGPVEQC